MSSGIGSLVSIPHVVKGDVVEDPAVEFPGADGGGFATPLLDLNELDWSRTQALPAAEVPFAEIIDQLVATGER